MGGVASGACPSKCISFHFIPNLQCDISAIAKNDGTKDWRVISHVVNGRLSSYPGSNHSIK
jgi:hypothetical protein